MAGKPMQVWVGGSEAFLGEGAPIASRPMSSLRKRAFDVFVSLLLLIFLLPLLALISLLVWIESDGPVLFCQVRGGLNGLPFTIYKFRTMAVQKDPETTIVQATRGDPRVTRAGSFLRKSSLDELPQLLNVLKGDMSLVGPRPHSIHHDLDFARKAANYHLRFVARPGITGLAQASGFRGELVTSNDLVSRLECDLRYIGSWSFAMDINILFRTVVVALFQSSAY